ncbi:hypothetical protein GCM10009678_74200 [Actinomadura kijaniata]|uniref:Uncharacterized protein n=1 Tax=Actinomadura namibiensis TaxID=182080 RepID=A0A7W3LRV8_ACTNM|nr:hypothetical protein [Actinomadura namibiensis]MBA8953163.1 hypothetical protein [Actinomadura namibiensis]
MNSGPKPTVESYERLAADLRGQTVLTVDYFVLMAGDEGTTPDEWDYGAWHEPTMGIELTMDPGFTYSATWNHTFGHYGLELYRAPISDFVINIGNPGGSARVTVTDHPSWASILASPIESCHILWSDQELGPGIPIPEAVHLRTATGQAWIVAGRSADYPPNGRFHLCTDDVLAAFDAETATQIGLKA